VWIRCRTRMKTARILVGRSALLTVLAMLGAPWRFSVGPPASRSCGGGRGHRARRLSHSHVPIADGRSAPGRTSRAVPRLTRELLLAGRCASCEQSLEGLATASDGCCVCSECGSAWNVEAMGVESRRLESRAIRDREDWFLQQVRVADVRGWERPIVVARRDAEARRACREAGQSLPPFWHSADGAASACAVIFCIVHTAFRGYGPWTASGMVAVICTPIVASFYGVTVRSVGRASSCSHAR
jgi:hypothetical protein